MSRRSPRKNQRKDDMLKGCGCPECSAKKATKKMMAATVAKAVTAAAPTKYRVRVWSYPQGWNLPEGS